MSGLPGSGLISHLPGGKALSNVLDGLQPPGLGHTGLPGSHIDPISMRQMGDGDGLLGAAGRQVSTLLDGTVPGGSGIPFAGNHDAPVTPASWNGALGTQGPPPWAGVPHEGRGDFGRGDFIGTPGPGGSPDDGPRTWNNGDGAPSWGVAPVANDDGLNVGDMVGGITRDAATLLGLTGRPVDVQGTLTQSGRFAFTEEQLPSDVVAGSLVRGDAGRVTPANRVAVGDEAIPVDRQVTTQRPDGVQQGARTETGADAEVIEWRPDGNALQRQGDQQNQIDPRMGWMSRVDQGPLLKLSLTVIPPVLREGEMTQSATRTALFRAVVNGQQAFIDSQGRIVGWAVRQDLPATYVAQVIHGEELMQLPDGRQVIVDSQGRLRSLATGELLRPVKAAGAADTRLVAENDARMLAERAAARLRETVWSTALPSCVGLLLVVAAFLSAAAVGAMPWTLHVLFLVAAVGLAVFCARTWKRCNRLPDGSVTRLPAITRRIRLLMALSCSAQGAGAVLLGTAAVLF